VQVNAFGNVPAADPSDPFTTGFAVVTAACPPGTDALGGGGTGTLAGVVDAQRSGPSASGNGWDILYHNKSTTASIVVEVTAVCASTT
jgi:hypothetical protein